MARASAAEDGRQRLVESGRGVLRSAADFWSVAVYDANTRSILDTGRPKSAINSYADLPVNADGSVDLHFGPTPPASGDTGWIKTNPGEGFFMYFRFCGALEPFYDKSWKPGDVVKVDG